MAQLSDLSGARQGHAADWQIGLAGRRHHRAETTRRPYRQRLQRALRPTATWRKVTGGVRSDRGAEPFAGVRSVVGIAARRGIDAYQAIRMTLQGESALAPG